MILSEEITKSSQNAFQKYIVCSRGGLGDGGRGGKQQASGECALSKQHNWTLERVQVDTVLAGSVCGTSSNTAAKGATTAR